MPLYNIKGEIRSHQEIWETGKKSYAAGGEKAGNFHVINGFDNLKEKSNVIICEGYATANTINEATDNQFAVVSACDCHNVELVAKLIKANMQDKEIIIAADDDRKLLATPIAKNVGLETAQAVAKEIGATLIKPEFRDERGSDFNDLAKIEGKHIVKAQIAKQLQVQKQMLDNTPKLVNNKQHSFKR